MDGRVRYDCVRVRLAFVSQAGKYFAKCGQYSRAVGLYLQCGDRMLDDAIKVVGLAHNDMLTHTLIDFLMGETDGVPKDPNFIFKLYMALGNFTQVCRLVTR